MVLKRKRTRGLRVVVQRVELGLLTDEFLSGSLDRGEIREIELDEENGILSCGLFELGNRILCFLF